MPPTPPPDMTSPLEPEEIWKAFASVQANGLGSMPWLGTAWLETMSDLGSEWLSFVADRVRQDVRTQHELLHAKSVDEIQHIQAAFLQKAMDDYRDETGKIVQFCAETMADIQSKAAKPSR